jgi:hypothetical protein
MRRCNCTRAGVAVWTAALAALVVLAGHVPKAWAHDAFITASFDGVGSSVAQMFEHEEDEPFKGYAYISLTNTGTEPWGDLHLQIFQVPGFGSIVNVDFIVDSPYQPYSIPPRSMTWVVDNDYYDGTYGATLDLYFYDDPVLPGGQAQFVVYTDNTTDQVPFFGLLVYPTPIPEPATLLLLAAGSLLLISRR